MKLKHLLPLSLVALLATACGNPNAPTTSTSTSSSFESSVSESTSSEESSSSSEESSSESSSSSSAETTPTPTFNGFVSIVSGDIDVKTDLSGAATGLHFNSPENTGYYVVALETDNEGPFDLSSYVIGAAGGTHNIHFEANQEEFYGMNEWASYAVYVAIELTSSTETEWLVILDSSENVVVNLQLTFPTSSGGDSTLATPEFNGNLDLYDYEQGEGKFDSKWNTIGFELYGKTGDKIAIYFECDNEGPFDLTGYEVAFENGHHLAQFAEDQTKYQNTKWDNMKIFVEITICGTATDNLLLADASGILFTLEISIGNTGGEGGEGGDSTLATPEFNGYIELYDFDQGEPNFDDMLNTTGFELNAKVGDIVVIYFGCENEGPFDLTGYEVAFINGYHTAQFPEDQTKYQNTKWDAKNVYVELIIGSTSTDTLLFASPTETLYTLEISIKDTSSEGGEGEGGTLPTPEFNGFIELYDIDQGEATFDSKWNVIGFELNAKVGDVVVIYYGCENFGPFNLTEYLIGFENASHLTQFAKDQTKYQNTKWDAMNVYVEITICSTLTDTLLLIGPEGTLYSLEISINENGAGGEGDEGGNTVATPDFNNFVTIVSGEIEAVQNSFTGETTELKLSNAKIGAKYVIGLETNNEGPFDLSGYQIGAAMGSHNIYFDEDQESYYSMSAWANAAVYVVIELGSTTATDYLVVLDSSENVLFELTLTIVASDGGEEDGEEVENKMLSDAIFNTLSLTNASLTCSAEMYYNGEWADSGFAMFKTDGTAASITSGSSTQTADGLFDLGFVMTEFDYASEIKFVGLTEKDGQYIAEKMIITLSANLVYAEHKDLDPSKCTCSNDGFEVEFKNVWIELDESGEYLSSIAYITTGVASWNGTGDENGNFDMQFTFDTSMTMDATYTFFNIGTTVVKE